VPTFGLDERLPGTPLRQNSQRRDRGAFEQQSHVDSSTIHKLSKVLAMQSLTNGEIPWLALVCNLWRWD
jgi:hypothetical protein